ncbi:hypothetical protein HOLleu_16833 [Holothuria leucospilota]|uniref:Protein kinase domain-containing protein n=1 Tax=Holothuria leucospilota TaxID=206669 RepID=A0A9Q1H831_HOLLE|nr:hypothetical protein HOLleu_16833 [Holothuria leucospilota]
MNLEYDMDTDLKLTYFRKSAMAIAIREAGQSFSNSCFDKAFVNEVTVLKILSGQEGFPCLYGVTSQLNVTLPAIVKGFIGNPSVARYLTLSEPIKLCQSTLLPLAKDADWICVSLFISRIIERLHHHGFTLGNTQEDQFALDINRLDRFQSGQLSAFLLDSGFIQPMPSHTHHSDESHSSAKEIDIASFGKIIFNIGRARKVPVLRALGEMCMNKDSKKRPLLGEVINFIEKAYALQVLNGSIT